MRCSCLQQRALALVGLTAVLIAVAVVPLTAQTNGDSQLAYNIKNEVTVAGVVSSVMDKPARGMMFGSHLLVDTASGTLDASLGRWAFIGKGAPSVITGQQVKLTGVMKTLNHRQVFLVRTLNVSGKSFSLRNEHGIPVPPQARERVQNAQKGVTL